MVLGTFWLLYEATGFFDDFLSPYHWWTRLPLVGFHPLAVLGMKSISLFYPFWIHTETIRRLPKPLAFVLNTPLHHRVHHASDVKYLERNHAGMLIGWDRLFGTFQRRQGNNCEFTCLPVAWALLRPEKRARES